MNCSLSCVWSLTPRTWSWAYWRNDCMCCPLLKDTGIAFRNSSGGSTKLKPGSWSNCVSPYRRVPLGALISSAPSPTIAHSGQSRLQIVCVFATGGIAARFVFDWSLYNNKQTHTYPYTHTRIYEDTVHQLFCPGCPDGFTAAICNAVENLGFRWESNSTQHKAQCVLVEAGLCLVPHE